MKYINLETGLKIVIEDKFIYNLYQFGLVHYPNEFGGILLGRYSDDRKTLNIIETILPENFKSTKYSFHRETKDLKGKLEIKFNDTPSLYYVGEWHTHPDNPAIPSQIDINAMDEIINHPDVFILNPVLVILDISLYHFDFAVYIKFKDKLYKYEKETE